MAKVTKDKSINEAKANPYLSGGGGFTFERQVQTYFIIKMILGLPLFIYNSTIKAEKITCQSSDKTDDMKIDYIYENGKGRGKLLAQIKHTLKFTPSDTEYQKTIIDAWKDFCKDDFNSETDRFFFITGPISSDKAIKHLRPIFNFAAIHRTQKKFKEWLSKVSVKKTEMFNTIKNFIVAYEKDCNKNFPEKITDDSVWEFCGCICFTTFDFDYEVYSKDKNNLLALIQQGMDKNSKKTSSDIHDYFFKKVAYFNQQGKVVVQEKDFSIDILSCFRRYVEKSANEIQELLLSGKSPRYLVINSELSDWKIFKKNKNSETWINNIKYLGLHLKYKKTIKYNHSRNIYEVILYFNSQPFFITKISQKTAGILSTYTKKDENNNTVFIDTYDNKILDIVCSKTGLSSITEINDSFFNNKEHYVVNRSEEFNMQSIRKIIEEGDEENLISLIIFAKANKKENWVNYIFKSEDSKLLWFGSNQDYGSDCQFFYKIGNIINLLLREGFQKNSVKRIIENFPNVELDNTDSSNFGFTPLLLAIKEKDFEFARYLIAKGASPYMHSNWAYHIQDNGWVPLAYCIDALGQLLVSTIKSDSINDQAIIDAIFSKQVNVEGISTDKLLNIRSCLSLISLMKSEKENLEYKAPIAYGDPNSVIDSVKYWFKPETYLYKKLMLLLILTPNKSPEISFNNIVKKRKQNNSEENPKASKNKKLTDNSSNHPKFFDDKITQKIVIGQIKFKKFTFNVIDKGSVDSQGRKGSCGFNALNIDRDKVKKIMLSSLKKLTVDQRNLIGEEIINGLLSGELVLSKKFIEQLKRKEQVINNNKIEINDMILNYSKASGLTNAGLTELIDYYKQHDSKIKNELLQARLKLVQSETKLEVFSTSEEVIADYLTKNISGEWLGMNVARVWAQLAGINLRIWRSNGSNELCCVNESEITADLQAESLDIYYRDNHYCQLKLTSDSLTKESRLDKTL